METINESKASAIKHWHPSYYTKIVQSNAVEYDKQLTEALKVGVRTSETEF